MLRKRSDSARTRQSGVREDSLQAEVDVIAYNSKNYYVITDGAGYGEQVYPFPVMGSETVLDAIGTKVFYCGPSGNGSIVKLCNNLCSQAQIAAAGEILILGVKAGVDLETLAGVIGMSTGTCRAIVETFPKQLFRRNFENPGFSSFLSAKDTHLALELAHQLGVPMEIGEIIERDKQEALRRGWGALAPDVFVRLQEERSGVVLELAPAIASATPS